MKSPFCQYFCQKKKIVLFKIHILAMPQSIARSRITGGHASMEVEVVNKTTKSGGFCNPEYEAVVRSRGPKPLSEAVVRS